MLERSRTAPTADERNTCLRVLGRAQKPELVEKTLELALNGEVKMQDIYMPIGGLGTTPEGIERRWKWMTENWDTLNERLPPSMTMLSSVVSICCAGFTKQEQLDKVQAFFNNKEKKGFDRSLEQSQDSIRSKINWLGRDSADVEQWIKDKGYHGLQGKL